MDKEKIITRIQDCGIVAVVRAETVDQAIRITDACIEGGVAAIELTFTVPHADKVIEELAKRYTPEEIILGAGTVLDAATARIAMLSGAEYIVSPALDIETLKLCNRYRVPYMPGCATITEVITAAIRAMMQTAFFLAKLRRDETFNIDIPKQDMSALLKNNLF